MTALEVLLEALQDVHVDPSEVSECLAALDELILIDSPSPSEEAVQVLLPTERPEIIDARKTVAKKLFGQRTGNLNFQVAKSKMFKLVTVFSLACIVVFAMISIFVGSSPVPLSVATLAAFSFGILPVLGLYSTQILWHIFTRFDGLYMAYSTITVGTFTAMLLSDVGSSVAIGGLVAGTMLAISGDAAPNRTGPIVMFLVLLHMILLGLGVFFGSRPDFTPRILGISFFRLSVKYQIYASCFAVGLFSCRFLVNSIYNSSHLLLVCGSRISNAPEEEARTNITTSLAAEMVESLAVRRKPAPKPNKIAPEGSGGHRTAPAAAPN